jgi:O-antigen/teichoic acid export membrane protein
MRGGDKKPIETAKLVSYGGRVFLVPVILLGIYRVDSFFLGYCTGASAVGFYSVALSFAELLLLIPESVGTILFPNLAYTAKSDVDKKFVFILKTSFLITAVATAVFFASIGYVLPLVYSSVYLESVGLVNILLPGMVAMSFYYLFSSYFQAVGRPGFVTVVLAAVFAEKLFLSWLLIPPMGAVGAAIASTIAYVTCFAAFLLAFRVKAKYGVSEIFALSRSELDYIRNSLNNIFDFQK